MISIPAHAEINGTLNFSIGNISITSGLAGHTVFTCNDDAGCSGYKCFVDWDGRSEGSTAGWCNETAITNCYTNVSSTSGASKAYSNGANICDTSTSYRTCGSGTWGNSTSCTSNKTCSAGECVSASSSSSSGSGGGGSGSNTTATTAVKKASIGIISAPENFNVTQGNSTTKYVVVKNTGDFVLFNVTLSVSGLDNWTIVYPIFLNLTKNNTATFSIIIKVPEKADVDVYKATLAVYTNYSSATAAGSFFMNVAPSEATVESEIVPRFNDYLLQLEKHKTNITDLEKSGIDVQDLLTLINNADDRLDKASRELQAGNYFEAKILLDEAESILNALTIKLIEKQAVKSSDNALIIVIIIVAIVGAIMSYMFYPSKKEEKFIKFQ